MQCSGFCYPEPGVDPTVRIIPRIPRQRDRIGKDLAGYPGRDYPGNDQYQQRTAEKRNIRHKKKPGQAGPENFLM